MQPSEPRTADAMVEALLEQANAQFEAGTPENMRQAIALLEEAAAHGSAEAHYRLASAYDVGLVGEPDKVRAFRHWEQAAELGEVWARLQVGRCYEFGEGCRADLDQAVAHFKQAAETGRYEGYADAARALDRKKRAREAVVFWDLFFQAIPEAPSSEELPGIAAALRDFLLARLKGPITEAQASQLNRHRQVLMEGTAQAIREAEQDGLPMLAGSYREDYETLKARFAPLRSDAAPFVAVAKKPFWRFW